MSGYITAQEAAELTGRKAGGNIHKLMQRHGVNTLRVKNAWMYYKPAVLKVPKLNSQAQRQIVNEYIDKQVKSPELPLGWMENEKQELMICQGAGKFGFCGSCTASIKHERNSFCDVTCQPGGHNCVPYVEKKANDAQSEDDLLHNIKAGLWEIKKDKSVGVVLSIAGEQKAWISTCFLIPIAREIVRRIDGETIKKTDMQPMIDNAVNQALDAFKEKIKKALL